MQRDNIFIFYYNESIANAICRYIKNVMSINGVEKVDINDHSAIVRAVPKIKDNDLVMIENVSGNIASGFQLAKEMKKKVLLVYGNIDLSIANEGPFWIVLPQKLSVLKKKINECIKNEIPKEEVFVQLENKYPELKERDYHN